MSKSKPKCIRFQYMEEEEVEEEEEEIIWVQADREPAIQWL